MEFRIGDRPVGDGHPVFFIAEAGVNHNGDLDLGRQLIRAARAAGADAVKFQTFRADRLNTRQAPKSSYHVATTGDDEEQTWFDLLRTQELTESMHVKLMECCREEGIVFLSTPYDELSADLLFALGVPAFKLASTDTSNLPLVRHVARKGRPLILSTAMCTMDEVAQAAGAAREAGLNDVAVLQCTGNYPSRLEDSNLRVMLTYRRDLGCLTGYSDHTQEIINPVAATALGASIFEKHFTLDRSLPGPDHRMSLEPAELAATVSAVRQTEAALGSPVKRVLPDEEENRLKLRKSLVAVRDIARGEVLSPDMLVAKRPGTGISPARLYDVLGRRALSAIAEETVLTESMVEGL